MRLLCDKSKKWNLILLNEHGISPVSLSPRRFEVGVVIFLLIAHERIRNGTLHLVFAEIECLESASQISRDGSDETVTREGEIPELR